MTNLKLVFVVFFSIFYMKYNVFGNTKFTNVVCEAHDKAFADFKECKLKVVGRGIIALAIHVRLYKVPVTDITINLSLYRKYSGYRPFMYNQTANFCQLMASINNSLSFLTIFFNTLVSNSNINHTCPYDHDIIVNNMIFEEKYLSLMPLPNGEYKYKLRVAAYKDWKATVSVNLLRNEKEI